jgi:hypothetical protein
MVEIQRIGRLVGRRGVSEAKRRAGVDEATRRLLLGFVVPTWLGAGLADWACHRATDIEHTAGRRESVIHAAMMTQAGIPALLGLLVEVNAGVLATTLAALGSHQVTAVWDVAYAEDRRKVTATEQHVHGLLEQVPVMATAFLFAAHWDQARALLPAAPERPRFKLEAKRKPLSRTYLAALFAEITGMIVVPYGNELWRCHRAAQDAKTQLR